MQRISAGRIGFIAFLAAITACLLLQTPSAVAFETDEPQPADIAGHWVSPQVGFIDFSQEGARVWGTSVIGNLVGEMSGNRCVFIYWRGETYEDATDDTRGSGAFDVDAGGRTLKGTWKTADTVYPEKGSFSALRVSTVPRNDTVQAGSDFGFLKIADGMKAAGVQLSSLFSKIPDPTGGLTGKMSQIFLYKVIPGGSLLDSDFFKVKAGGMDFFMKKTDAPILRELQQITGVNLSGYETNINSMKQYIGELMKLKVDLMNLSDDDLYEFGGTVDEGLEMRDGTVFEIQGTINYNIQEMDTVRSDMSNTMLMNDTINDMLRTFDDTSQAGAENIR